MQPDETFVVIDDEKEIRTLVELALARTGRTVIGFDDGDDALRFLSSGVPVDLVVSDIAMEGYDGHRLLRHLRSDPATASTPVLFVVEGDDVRAAIGGLSDRGVSVVHKPFDIDGLRRAAESAVLHRPREAPLRDRVTGLLTRADFDQFVENAIEDRARSGAPCAVIFGVVAFESSDAPDRDEAFRRVADIVHNQLRGSDVACRAAESAFATLHRACDHAGAAIVAQRIVAAVGHDRGCASVSVRVGVASVSGADGDAEAASLMRSAESAASTGEPIP